jgi:signal transduction histidine kinase
MLLWTIAFAIRGVASMIFSIDLDLPSIVDLLRIAGSVAILAAVAVYPAFPGGGFGRIRVLLDVGMLILGAGTLYWLIFFRSLFLVGIGDPIPAFWAQIHAGFDIIFLPLCLRIILLKKDPQEKYALYAISAAAVFFTIADLDYGYQVLQGKEVISGFVAAVQILGGLFIIFASNYLLNKWEAKRRSDSAPSSGISGKQMEAWLPIILSYTVVGFILIDWWLISGEVDWFSIRVAILMVVLLIGRQGVIIGQSELRRYAELVNATTDLAFITDASGDIRLTNPAFRDALLIKESENSPNLSTVVTTGTSLEILISIASVSGWSGEITFIRKDGTSFPGTLSLIPIRDTREQRDLFAATGHDLTQVKLRESELHTAMDNLSSAQHDLQSLNAELEKKVDIRTQELKEMVVHLDTLNKDLQALDELKTEFVALVSHELRAPLTTIRTGLDILLKSHSELDQSALETIKLITDETSRLGGFVETILDISALEAGRFPVQVRPLSLTDLLEEVCTQFPTLVADDQAVRSVLFHVLDNAVKYAPKGEVNLIASRDGTDFVIEVRDQGPGIPKAHREKVFEMFYRIDTSDSREVYGRGLGLTLAKRFMDVIGGSIEIIDPGPHGAVIRIKIPNQSQGAAS